MRTDCKGKVLGLLKESVNLRIFWGDPKQKKNMKNEVKLEFIELNKSVLDEA